MSAGFATVGYSDPATSTVKSVVVYVDASGNLNESQVGAFLVGTTPTAVSASNPLPVNFTNTTLPVTGTFWQATQPISAAALPLPTGASTAANQTTGNTSLASIDGKVTACNTAAVVVASGSVTANAGTNLNTSALALETGGNLATIAGKDFATQTTLAALNAKLPSLGQALAAASVPVVLTAAQQTALTPPAAITGFALDATLSALSGKVTACNTGAVGLAAGTNTIGVAVSPQQTGAVYSGTTALTPKFAAITASSSGVTNILALVAGKKIRVLSLTLVANAAVNVKFQSHVTPTDLTGLFYLGANGGFVLNFSPTGHFETITGEALDINLSGAVAVGGVLTYIEV